MTGPLPAKEDPPDLHVRARPPRVTRLSRRALMMAAAIGGAAVIGALWYGLGLKPIHLAGGPELYNTDAKPATDALAGLPRTYADIPKPPPPAVPLLGPPLPGDLGRPIVRAQTGTPTLGATNDDEAERQRREQAAASNVLFSIAARPSVVPAALAASPAPAGTLGGAMVSGDTDQNLQDHKQAFLNASADRQIYSGQALQTPRSPYQLMAGTVIAAALVTGLNSDLPGEVVAQVTEDVYDSVSGRYLLVPQGARLIGRYDSAVAYGQQRVLLAWTRLIMPDGSSIVLDNLSATDAQGQAGLEDGVDIHTWRLLKGAALSTLLGISSELAGNGGTQSGNRIIVATRDSADSSANQVGQRMASKDLAIQPTLTVRPGFPVLVLVNRDIILRPYQG